MNAAVEAAALAAEVPRAVGRMGAQGLQKSYGARKVVKDVHLAVDAGEVVGLLGPNGAGKTTTFNMVVGVVKPDHGEVLFDEASVTRRPSRPPRRRRSPARRSSNPAAASGNRVERRRR